MFEVPTPSRKGGKIGLMFGIRIARFQDVCYIDPLGKGQVNFLEPIPIIKHGSKGVAFGWYRQQYQSIQLGDQDAIRDNVRGFLHLVTRLRR